jgi:hypothetical protein
MKEKKIPPYLSFSTFTSFLDALRVSGVPTRVDRSIMASKSGSTQVLLLSAIRYLGLASDNGIPTPDLERLVQSEGKQNQEVWHRILTKAYPALFRLDLQRATTQQLSEALSKGGLASPDTIRKSLNFFSLAAKKAGIKLSPHIKPYAGLRQTGRRARGWVEQQKETIYRPSSLFATDRNGSTEWEMLLSKFPDFDPSWPDDLRENWLNGFERLSRMLNTAKATDEVTPRS